MPRFEPLEQRQLLAANILASLQLGISSPGDVQSLQLDVDGGDSTLLALRMHGLDGTLDPNRMAIETLDGHTIAPIVSKADVNGSNDSLLLVELGPGSYSVLVRGEGSTTGAYQLDVYLPGDLSGDGVVDQDELFWASAAMVQDQGAGNHVTWLFYQSMGINLSDDLYRDQLDTDLDGDIDTADYALLQKNVSRAGVTAELIGDVNAPAIAAALANDTGRSATDGVTNELAIAGTIEDQRDIVAFRAGLDGMDAADYVDLLGEVNTEGQFQLSQTRLEEILGASVANNGSHTLYLVAEDDLGNATATPYTVTFTLDTIAPDAPTALDLTTESDLGFADDDNITADNTPTITAEAEADAMVALTSSLDGFVGDSLAGSTASITTAALSDGTHQLTATATDLAGNTSAASGPLEITVETVAPATPAFDLDAASDTGTLGDQLTALTTVTLEGITEPGARVTLEQTGATLTADGAGAFSFSGVPLAFGPNTLTVVAMDSAGNTSEFSSVITQNNAPTSSVVAPYETTEDPGELTVDLSGMFADADFAAGDTLVLSILDNSNPELVAPSLIGSTSHITNNTLRMTFGQDRSGTAIIHIRATDQAGEFVDGTFVVNVAAVNDAPVAGTPSGPVGVEENGSVDIDLRTLASDVETPDEDLIFAVSNPVHGTVELIDGHIARFTPAADYNGPASFDYTVTDQVESPDVPLSASATVLLAVGPFNDPPVAETPSEPVTVDEDGSVDIDLWTLASDTETADEDLIFAVSGAQHGTVQLIDGHIARFTPAEDYNGPASFAYSVTDTGDGEAAAITVGPVTIDVTVTPVNDAPVAGTPDAPVGVDEDGSVDIDLRELASDLETINEDLTFAVSDAQHGTVTLVDGHIARFTPAADYHGPASFTYTVTDQAESPETPLSDSAVILLVVGAVNDPPVAETPSEPVTVDEDGSVDIDLWTLTSDTETPDAQLTYTLSGAQHGTVTLIDGHIARFSPAADYNGPASFAYSVTDTGDGEAAAITVGPVTINVTVAPVNDPPVAGTPDAPVDVEENGSVDIDLRLLASDLETPDEELAFSVGDAINGTVTLVDGHIARFAPAADYLGSASFAYSVTDTGDEPNTVGPVTINLLVSEAQPVGIYLVIRETATPVGETTTTVLPESIDEIGVGDTYVVEVWLLDTYGDGTSPGLTGAYVDLMFNPSFGEAAAVSYAGPFDMPYFYGESDIQNAAGLIHEFGSGTLDAGLAVEPNYMRLGYATFLASADGVQTFAMDLIEVSRFAGGLVDAEKVMLDTASITQVSQMHSLTLDVAFQATVQIDGVVRGEDVTATSGSSHSTIGLTGTLEILVDDLDNPTVMQIVSATLDIPTNIGDGPFLPGVGGSMSTPAAADFALMDAETSGSFAMLAIRDWLSGLSTDGTVSVTGTGFRADLIDWVGTGGFVDIFTTTDGGQRINLDGVEATPTGEEFGSLTQVDDQYTLSFTFERQIDLSSYIPDTVLTITGTYVATENSGAPLMGTESADADADNTVHMTLVQAPTAVDQFGRAAVLPESKAWIDEWDSYWVEVWVKASEAAPLGAVAVDLAYNASYFTATAIDHGSVFVANASGELAQDGLVAILGGTAATAAGGDGYVLVGRVKFESLDGDQVPIDADNQVLRSHDLGLELGNLRLESADGAAVEAAVGRTPKTVVVPVAYDIDDDGRIGLGDLSYFAGGYGDHVLDSASPFVWTMDFDRSGTISLGDLSFFAGNYGKARGDGQDIIFPENFLQAWIGAGLDVEGDATVGAVLDAAVATWQQKLGLDEPIAIQLVVRDLGSSQLGFGQIIALGEDGRPTLGRVTIDDDAAGLGWSASLDAAPGAQQYDLYTVLLHEVGHSLGFLSSYDAFASLVQSTDDGLVFVGPNFTATLDGSGQHLDATVAPNDVMSASLAPGVRKTLSDLDAQILLAAYEAASGVSGFSPTVGAPLEVDSMSALWSNAHATSDFVPIVDRLEGEVTWQQLLRINQPAATTSVAETGARFEAVDALYAAEIARWDDVAGTTRTARPLSDAAGEPSELDAAMLAEMVAWQSGPSNDQIEPSELDILLAEWPS